MTPSDWIQLSTSLLLACVALFIAFVGNWWFEKRKRKTYAPLLDINHKYEEPYRHKTIMRHDKIIEGKKISEIYCPCYYFNFSVTNSGLSAAEDCEAVLEKVWQNGKLWRNFLPINIRWAFGEPPEKIRKTIYPGRTVHCNIGYIEKCPDVKDPNGKVKYGCEYSRSGYQGATPQQQEQDKFFFDSPHRLYVQWDCLIPSKDLYVIQISVYGKNTDKKTGIFEITWFDGWEDKEEDMYGKFIISYPAKSALGMNEEIVSDEKNSSS